MAGNARSTIHLSVPSPRGNFSSGTPLRHSYGPGPDPDPDFSLSPVGRAEPFQFAMERLHITLKNSVNFFNDLIENFNKWAKNTPYSPEKYTAKWKSKLATAKIDEEPIAVDPRESILSISSSIRVSIVLESGPRQSRVLDEGESIETLHAQPSWAKMGFGEVIRQLFCDLQDAIDADWPPECEFGCVKRLSKEDLVFLDKLRENLQKRYPKMLKLRDAVWESPNSLRMFTEHAEMIQLFMNREMKLWQLKKKKKLRNFLRRRRER